MATATLYSVRDWSKHFENNRTRELKKLDWVPIRNKQDGDGYTELLAETDGVALFGAWIIIVQIASKCTPRGTLIREDGTPHTSQSLARMSRAPAGLLCRALLVLVRVGWLQSVPYEIPQSPAAIPHPSEIALTGREGNEGKGREGNTHSLNGAEVPSWEEFWTYCQMGHGPEAEWYAKDRFLAADQDNWKNKSNWHSYAARCRTWWEADGRPMSPKGNGINGKTSPYVQLKALEKEISEHPANKDSLSRVLKPTEAQFLNLRDLRAKYGALNKQIANA